ncbi:MAG: DNA-binding protein [Halobacteriales archaeon]
MSTTLDPDIDVPSAETPTAECQHCGRPFDTERARDLHVGKCHAEAATEAEMAAYEDAEETERDELFFFHFKVVVSLGVVYAVLVIVYMAALGGGFL